MTELKEAADSASIPCNVRDVAHGNTAGSAASQSLVWPGTRLVDYTIYVCQMEDGTHLITTPKQLPKFVSWEHCAEHTPEKEITEQNINIHHLFAELGMYDHGHTDWRLPTMPGGKNHWDDECWRLWQFSENEGRNLFDKSGSFPASCVWSARRYDGYYAYSQWLDDGRQYRDYRGRELSVRPVRRVNDLTLQSLLSTESRGSSFLCTTSPLITEEVRELVLRATNQLLDALDEQLMTDEQIKYMADRFKQRQENPPECSAAQELLQLLSECADFLSKEGYVTFAKVIENVISRHAIRY